MAWVFCVGVGLVFNGRPIVGIITILVAVGHHCS